MPTDGSALVEELLPHQQLDLNARKGRYGVVYMRAIAGQAGCGLDETSPGEDTLAIDYTINFPEGGARVQVKTTQKYSVDGNEDYLRFDATPTWIAKWAKIKVPLYFVIVIVPSDSGAWLNHDDSGTLLVKTAAYWVKLEPGQFDNSKTIKIPRAQRVTAETMTVWHKDYINLFAPTAKEVIA